MRRIIVNLILKCLIFKLIVATANGQNDFGFSLSPGGILKSVLDSKLDKLHEMAKRRYTDDNNSLECYNGFVNLRNGIENGEMWAFKVLDSWSKMSSGYLEGNIVNQGNFDECLTINEWNGTQLMYKGQYCLLPLRPAIVTDMLQSVSIKEEYKSYIGIALATCIPSYCAPDFYQDILAELFNLTTMKNDILSMYSVCQTSEEYEYRNLDIFAMCFFATITILVFLSTMYEVTVTEKGKPNKLLGAFSVITHGKSIFKMNKVKNDHTITCLDGIRALAIISVVLSHAYIYNGFIVPAVNKLKLFKDLYKFDMVSLFTVSFHSTHLFLFLSGFLLGWTVFRVLDKTKTLGFIPKMYLFRYIRVTPPYAVSILIFTTFQKMWADGPFKPMIIDGAEKCERTWWSHLLYIQTFYNIAVQCPPGSWYLSVDFHLFVISPLIFIPLWKYGRKMLIIPILLLLAATINTWWALESLNFNYSELISTSLGKYGANMQTIFLTAQHRCSPWLIGMILSKIMYDQRGRKIDLKTYNLDVIGWTVSALFAIFVFSRTHMMLNVFNVTFTPFSSRIYHILFHNMLSMTVAWCVYASYNGSGGIINKVLSLKVWTPIARLSYSIYLVNVIVLSICASRMRTAITLDRFSLFTDFLGIMGLTILVAIPFRIAFETSFQTIMDAILAPKKSRSKTNFEIESGNTKTVFQNEAKLEERKK